MAQHNGIIPVYKPVGPATFDIIRIFRKKTNFKGKIGHGGSLDPFACGVVLLLLGKTTEKFEEIRTWAKVYTAGIRLGAKSTTGDVTGEISIDKSQELVKIRRPLVEDILKIFIGETEQKVPSYSAAKYQGTPLYKLARQGVKVEKTKKVKIFNIELIDLKIPIIAIKITCAGGVYIRQLAEDIAQKIGTDGFLFFLEREKVGNFSIKDCIKIEDFGKINIQ
ncbi:MAG: tRNA pseudouridine(55) synthase TruB [candidate division WOR-3 bacterium]